MLGDDYSSFDTQDLIDGGNIDYRLGCDRRVSARA